MDIVGGEPPADARQGGLVLAGSEPVIQRFEVEALLRRTPLRVVLLDLALREPHHRDVLLQPETIDRVHIDAADLPQHRRRRNREPTVQQEPDHPPLASSNSARTPPRTTGRPTGPRASRDRRVGSRSRPRRRLQTIATSSTRKGSISDHEANRGTVHDQKSTPQARPSERGSYRTTTPPESQKRSAQPLRGSLLLVTPPPEPRQAVRAVPRSQRFSVRAVAAPVEIDLEGIEPLGVRVHRRAFCPTRWMPRCATILTGSPWPCTMSAPRSGGLPASRPSSPSARRKARRGRRRRAS
jgi:hypothetical protein